MPRHPCGPRLENVCPLESVRGDVILRLEESCGFELGEHDDLADDDGTSQGGRDGADLIVLCLRVRVRQGAVSTRYCRRAALMEACLFGGSARSGAHESWRCTSCLPCCLTCGTAAMAEVAESRPRVWFTDGPAGCSCWQIGTSRLVRLVSTHGRLDLFSSQQLAQRSSTGQEGRG